MLEGILSFGEKEVCEIMIPRIDVTAIEYHDGYRQVLDTITTTGYSRIPVYDTSQDSIRGILYSKGPASLYRDLLRRLQLAETSA